MSTALWLGIVIGILAATISLLRLLTSPTDKAMKEALEKHDVTAILKAIDSLRPQSRKTALNHAISRMWENYERQLATDLIMELAKRYGDSLIAQYWLKQLITVEPQIARQRLPQDFIQTHYRPELAAQCGPVG